MYVSRLLALINASLMNTMQGISDTPAWVVAKANQYARLTGNAINAVVCAVAVGTLAAVSCAVLSLGASDPSRRGVNASIMTFVVEWPACPAPLPKFKPPS